MEYPPDGYTFVNNDVIQSIHPDVPGSPIVVDVNGSGCAPQVGGSRYRRCNKSRARRKSRRKLKRKSKKKSRRRSRRRLKKSRKN